MKTFRILLLVGINLVNGSEKKEISEICPCSYCSIFFENQSSNCIFDEVSEWDATNSETNQFLMKTLFKVLETVDVERKKRCQEKIFETASKFEERGGNAALGDVRNIFESRRDFLKAVEEGRLNDVELLANDNGWIDVYLNEVDENGCTAVNIAAANGRTEVVKFFAEHGADLNKADNFGFTPMHFAVLNDRTEVVKVLAETGADLNRANNFGYTPVNIAARRGYTEVVKVLIDSKVKLDESLTSIAKTDEIKQLIEDALEKRRDLHKAVELGIPSLVKILANEVSLNEANEYGWTPVNKAAAHCYKEVVEVLKILAEHGADLDKAGNFGFTPVHFAVLNGRTEVVKFLADQGADLDKATNDGRTPAYTAACKGQTEVLKLLAKHGADLNKANNFGYTPVRNAAAEGHTEVVKVLIDSKVKLDKSLLSIAENEKIKQLIQNAIAEK